jgi:hypothetical protein
MTMTEHARICSVIAGFHRIEVEAFTISMSCTVLYCGLSNRNERVFVRYVFWKDLAS